MPLGVAVLYNFKSGVAIVRVLEYNRHINHGGRIMEIMSAREAANKWGISQRRVALLCSEGRIAQAQMVGNSWAIPKTAAKPTDGRSLIYYERRNLGNAFFIVGGWKRTASFGNRKVLSFF